MKNLDMEKEMMRRGEVMLDAIGDIKDEYVVEADAENMAATDGAFTVIEGATGDLAKSFTGDSKHKGPEINSKKKIWMRVVSVAAILVLCVGVGSAAIKNMFATKEAEIPMESAHEGVSSAEPKPEEPALAAEPAEGAYEGSAAINEAEKPAEMEVVEESLGEAEIETEESFEGEHKSEEAESEVDESVVIDDTFEPYEPAQGEAFVLTAGQWNDNDNWPFFTNLVNSGVINFPSYGIDPRNRIKVTVMDEGGNALANETVYLKDGDSGTVWQAKTNKEGIAYLFVPEGSESPAYVECNGVAEGLEVAIIDVDYEPGSENYPGEPPAPIQSDDVTIVTSKASENTSGVQVMFIVDTTGSMGDELVYLQMDFMQIAEDTAGEGMMYSANFYRDEGDKYVTKTNGFTSDTAEVQRLISEEYATGGGDTPEAVADILYETITANSEWRSDMNKVCFLIFDAPPHYGTEDRIVEAVESAAARGIHIVPVVASNAERETELFGRALAICTDGEYVFLTDDSGVGYSHLEPIIGDYSVELLHDIIVRIINGYK